MITILIFGVADPLAYRNHGASTDDTDISSLCAGWRQRHLALSWIPHQEGNIYIASESTAACAGGVLGIVIAATCNDYHAPQVVAIDPFSDPPHLDEIMDLRVLSGIRQATSDWELVRLTGALIDLSLPAGRMWLITTPNTTA